MALNLTITHSVPLKPIDRYSRQPHLKVDKPRSTKHSEKQNQNRTGLKSEKLLPHDNTQSVPSESQVSTERPAKKLSLENTNPSSTHISSYVLIADVGPM